MQPFVSRWLPIIRWGITLVVGLCFAGSIWMAWTEWCQQPILLSSLRWERILLAVLLYVASISAGGFYWHRVLTVVQQKVDLGSALRIFYASQLGKYVPGKAMVVLIRATSLQKLGVPFKVGVTSVFIETLTWIAVGAAWGAFALACWVRTEGWLAAAACVVALVATLPTYPTVLRKVLQRLSFESNLVERFRLRDIGVGWLTFSIGWGLSASSLWVLLSAFPLAASESIGQGLTGSGQASAALQLADLGICMAAVSLASVFGFVSLLPGGLGVRELVMLPLLSSRFGFAQATMVILALRLVWMVSEFLLVAICSLSHRQTSSKHQGETGPHAV